MLYEIIPLERDSSFRVSSVGYEKTITLNMMSHLDESYYRTFTGYGDEAVIGIGTQLETTDPSLILTPSLHKGLGYTSSAIDGPVCYEVLFYRQDRSMVPYKVSYRTQKNPRPVELVNYHSLENIYADIHGKYFGSVIDPRMEILTTRVVGDLYGAGQGLVDVASDILTQHPLFGQWARHSLSGNQVANEISNVVSKIKNCAQAPQFSLHPNVMADNVLPLEIPRPLALQLRQITSDPRQWLMGSEFHVSYKSTPFTPRCASIDLNSKRLQGVVDVIMGMSYTDFSMILKFDGQPYSEVFSEYAVNRYATCINIKDAHLRIEQSELTHLCSFELWDYFSDRQFNRNFPLFVRIEKSFNDEIMISYFQNERDILHQIYFDTALLSLCSMGISVINPFSR